MSDRSGGEVGVNRREFLRFRGLIRKRLRTRTRILFFQLIHATLLRAVEPLTRVLRFISTWRRRRGFLGAVLLGMQGDHLLLKSYSTVMLGFFRTAQCIDLFSDCQ